MSTFGRLYDVTRAAIMADDLLPTDPNPAGTNFGSYLAKAVENYLANNPTLMIGDTMSTTPKVSNPYDRRDRPRPNAESGIRWETQTVVDGHAGEARLERADEIDHPGLTLRDLEQLIAGKVRRARRDGDDAAYLRTRGELQEARREAFDEGAKAAAGERAEAVWVLYNERLGDLMHALHEQAVKTIDSDASTKAGRERRKVAALLELVREVAMVTDLAIREHNGPARHAAMTGEVVEPKAYGGKLREPRTDDGQPVPF